MRAVLILLSALVLAAGLSLATFIWVLDDDDYRGLVTWLARVTLDTELTISPDFRFTFGRHIVMQASTVSLASDDGQLSATVENLAATVDLFALRRGTILIEHLATDGGQIRWVNDGRSADGRPETPTFLPLAQRLKIRNLDIGIDPAGGSEPLLVELTEFDLDAPAETEPVVVSAVGRINGRELTIEGTLGRADQFWSPPEEGLPIQLKGESPNATAELTGSIADPVGLRGADIKLVYLAKSIETTLAPFLDIPDLGSANISARLTGNLRDPTTSEFHIQTSRAGLTMAAKGQIASLFSINGIELDLFAAVEPRVVAPDGPGQFTHVNLQGRLTGERRSLKLTDLNGFSTLASGGDLTVKGDGELALAGARRTSELNLAIRSRPSGLATDADTSPIVQLPALTLEAKFSHDDRRLFADLSSLEDQGESLYTEVTAHLDDSLAISRLSLEGDVRIPDGPRLHLTGRIEPHDDGLKLSTLSIRDEESGAHVTAAGDLGAQHPDAPWGPIDLDVQGTGDAGRLLGLLGLETATGIDSVQLQMRLKGTAEKLAAPQLALTLGGDAGITGQMSGEIEAISLAGLSGVQVGATLKAPSTSNVGKALGHDSFPDLGAVEVDAHLTDQDGSLGLESLTLSISRDDDTVLELSGAIDDVFGRSEIRWAGKADVDLSALLAEWVDPDVQLGVLHGEFVLSDEDGSLGFESFTLAADKETVHSSNLSGSFDDFTNFSDLQAEARIDIADTRTLNRLLGAAHRVEGPIRVSGNLTGDNRHVRYIGNAEIGRNHLDTRLVVDLTLDRPRITASVVAPVLYPRDMGLAGLQSLDTSAETTADSKTKRTRLFSDAPLDLSWLDRQDLDLTLRVDSIPSREYALKDLDVRARIEGGELTLDRWEATYSGGALSGSARLANSSPPEANIKVIGDDVAFGEVLALITGTRTIRAAMSTRSELSTHGRSIHEMASNLEGEVGIVLEHGEFPRRTIDLIGVDLFGWTLGTVSGRGATAQFQCVIGRFSVESGMITTNALFLDGPNLAVTGAGTIDLGAETIDAKFLPKNKRRFWGRTTPVHLTGSLANPTVTAIPARAMAQEVGTLALVPQFYLPARALGFMFGAVRDDDENSPCLTEQDLDTLREGLPED